MKGISFQIQKAGRYRERAYFVSIKREKHLKCPEDIEKKAKLKKLF